MSEKNFELLGKVVTPTYHLIDKGRDFYGQKGHVVAINHSAPYNGLRLQVQFPWATHATWLTRSCVRVAF